MATHDVNTATSGLLFLVLLKMEGKTIFMASSKVILLILLVVSAKQFRAVTRQ
jgi:hypothetical protein